MWNNIAMILAHTEYRGLANQYAHNVISTFIRRCPNVMDVVETLKQRVVCILVAHRIGIQ